ncbi:MAG: hypothetical protein IT239_04985 [Bacteroidia bacterium]|nr:hypothetical protein [Bacteroidia bacterium]
MVFWGSGLLKDTITISAVGWFTYGFYFGFIKKKRILTNSLNVLIASFLLANIKPYILFALIPGSITWLLTFYSTKIKSPIFKFTFSFIFLIVSVLLSYYLLASMEGALGSFSVENVIDKASTTQQDMKRDYNEGNSFDIGTFDGSISGLLFIAPQAINAALFRPYIWETKSIVMLLSSLENTILLWLTIFLLIKLKFIGFFKFIGKNSLLTFSILFSLFFAFSVGLSISNFGALVRLKIPCMPFFAATIFIITDFYLKNKERIKINKY